VERLKPFRRWDPETGGNHSGLGSRLSLILGVPLLALIAAALVPLTSSASPRRQQASAQASAAQNTSDTIRVTTRLVQIGVIVRDKNGAVTNLSKDDFTILEKGKPQTISVFSADAASRTAEAAAAASAEKAPALPPGTFTNLPLYTAPEQSGSITIVLLDNLNTMYGSMPSPNENMAAWTEDMALANAKNQLVKFVEGMKPDDRVAIYALRESLHVLSDFTSDRQQLLALLKKYDPTSLTSRKVAEPGGQHAPVLDGEADGFESESSMELAAMRNTDRAVETAAALQEIVGHVSNIPGRKNLVWLTADLPLSGATMARILGPDIAVYPVDARGLLALNSKVMLQDMKVYPGTDDFSGGTLPIASPQHDDSSPAESSQPQGIGEMRELARQTGGQAFVNTNDITGAIRRAVENSEITYTLGFYVDAKAADDKFHELKVEVKEKGFAVFYPAGYFAYREEPPKADVNRASVITAVQSPIESSAIPMTASFEREPLRENHSLKMEGQIEINNVVLRKNGNFREGAVDVDVLQQDATGKVLGHSADHLRLRFTPDGYAKALQQGVKLQKTIPLYPGGVTLRVLVQDPATGKLGSLVVPLEKIQ
jgi:VWFA-related protein